MAEEKVHGCLQLGVHPNQGDHSKICQKIDEINKENHGKQGHFVLRFSVIPKKMNSFMEEQLSLPILLCSCLYSWKNIFESK